MAYAFNDSKGKVNVYEKKDFVYIEGSKTMASTTTVTLSETLLRNSYGIEDVRQYVPICVMQSYSPDRSDFTTVAKAGNGSGTEVGNYPVYPSLSYRGKTLYLMLAGSDNLETVNYKIVLMKI